jgi:hypothetical protein
VTAHSGIVTGDSGHAQKSVTINQNRRSRLVGTTGHVQTESVVKMGRNTHLKASLAGNVFSVVAKMYRLIVLKQNSKINKPSTLRHLTPANYRG